MLLTLLITAAFLTYERLVPGRFLPAVSGWYTRALAINAVQAIISLGVWQGWVRFGPQEQLLHLISWKLPLLEGFTCWIIGSFVFYWWHRIRHLDGWWVIFHQIHHSPSRIELLTSFYKHPVEILADALLAAVLCLYVLGASSEAYLWFNFFAALGEYFYHSNIRTPPFIRYLIQTPELHSIHHELGVHKYNFSDLPLWDRLFGTYKDTVQFAERCGFPADHETRLGRMLAFHDVYENG